MGWGWVRLLAGVDLSRLWKQLHPIELWPTLPSGFKSASLTQVCTFPGSLHTPFSLLQRFIYLCTSGMAFPGVIKSVILLPQVITSLWSHTHFLFSLPFHPKHHPTLQDNVISTAPWAKTSLQAELFFGFTLATN